MKHLEESWLTDGLVDFEYKKYKLLAYSQEVKQSFNRLKLYPFMNDLIMHYNNILAFQKNKNLMEKQFPGKIEGVDMELLKIIYQKVIDNNEMMREIEQIIEFAKPIFKGNLDEGKEIYEFVEKNCELTPVGLMPIYTDEGYVFLEQQKRNETEVYRYRMTVFQSASETYRGIHTNYIDTFSRNLGETYESLKLNLSRKLKDLPNPAVFAVNTKLKFPKKSTLLPVVKRLLVRYISTA